MTVRLAFLGDTLLGGEAQDVLDKYGYRHALRGIEPLLGGADLVVANHEGPLTTRAEPETKIDNGRKRYWYRADPASTEALTDAGVGVVSLANNHVCDFGPDGLVDTLANLDAAGIAHCGAGSDGPAARRPAIVDLKGLRVGFLSAMQRYHLYVQDRLYATSTRPGPARLRMTTMADDLTALRKRVDLCVVLVHWGMNYRGVTTRQRRLAHELADAGADLIVGHHPHVPQRVEVIGHTPVFYSLGNAALGTPGRFHSGRAPYGLIAVVDVDQGEIVRLQLDVIQVDNTCVRYQPQPATAQDSSRLLDELVEPTLRADIKSAATSHALHRVDHVLWRRVCGTSC